VEIGGHGDWREEAEGCMRRDSFQRRKRELKRGFEGSTERRDDVCGLTGSSERGDSETAREQQWQDGEGAT
jgi:hypothetical protein